MKAEMPISCLTARMARDVTHRSQDQDTPKSLRHPNGMVIYAELKRSYLETFSNKLKKLGIKSLSDNKMSDAWFLLADAPQTGLRVIQRTGVETRAATPDSVGFQTDAILYKARYRWQVGATHPYGVYGSPGA